MSPNSRQAATEIAEQLKAPIALTTLAISFSLGALLVGRLFPELGKIDDRLTPPANAR